MKKLLTFLLFCFFSTFCFSQETEKLPEMPWANIAEMNQVPNLEETLWKGNVFVKLQGFYTLEDSLIVAEAIQELDSLTETISIKFSTHPRGNLEVFFMDTAWFPSVGDYYVSASSKYTSLYTNVTSQSSHTADMGRVYTRLFIAKDTSGNYENLLKNSIATALVPGSLRWDESERITQERKSIFDVKLGSSFGDLNDLDKAIIRETYRAGYKDRLETAMQQFNPQESSIVWLKKNPFIYMLLPLGLILLLVFLLSQQISKITAKWIKNGWLRFNLNGTIIILLLVVIINFYTEISHNIQYNNILTSFADSFFHNLRAFAFVGLVFGLPSINLLRVIENLIHKNTHRKVLKVVLIFLSTGLIPFCSFFAIAYFTDRDGFSRSNNDFEVLSYVFVGGIILAAFRALISYFIFKEKDLIIENETKLIQLRELKTKAELNALHSRINPHFLYNSLNSIAGLAHTNADQTEHMALSLSKLFRYSINKEKSDWTTFREELEMVKIYLDVEKVRFADRLVYSIEITDELKEMKIPRFIIQPLAENAVKHGISKSIEGGEIKIKVQKEKKDILITVADSGKEFPSDLTPGFGLQSIYDKLEILYGDKFELSFTNSPEKQVSLKLK